MIALYVASMEAMTGKTALCAGIGKQLQGEGKKVAFFKPITVTSQLPLTEVDRDTVFISNMLGIEVIYPFSLARADLKETLDSGNLDKELDKAHTRIAAGKEVIILEGLSDLGRDSELTQASLKVINVFGAQIVIVLRYSTALPWAEIATIREKLGGCFVGLVINCAPEAKIKSVRDTIETLSQKEGVRILGVLPQSRTLAAVGTGELAEHLEGKVVTCPQDTTELVENIMIGAMSVDPGPQYFTRKTNKAVVVRGERPDIQLAALETSTRCLILTGNVPPIPTVHYQAEDKGVPIIVVKSDTLTTVAGIEAALSKAKFSSPKKLSRFNHILKEYFDFTTLFQKLGITS